MGKGGNHMVTPPKRSGGLFPTAGLTRYQAPASQTIPRNARRDSQFDQVNISREPGGTEQFQREVVSRLVREVRTTHSAFDIQKIKDQVQSGSFKPDAAEVAAKLLLEEQRCGNE
jgi:anti-sigma28 factor (negative regulator of flagellin synthesis)